MTGVEESPRPRWAAARCFVCGGRVRIDWGVLKNWTTCKNSGCGASSCVPFLDGRPWHRIRVALAVPAWKWWTIHSGWPAWVWSAVTYRWPNPIVHQIGGHIGWRRYPDGSGSCSWCGASRGRSNG